MGFNSAFKGLTPSSGTLTPTVPIVVGVQIPEEGADNAKM